MRLISKIIGNQEKPVSNTGDSLGSSITLNGNPLSFSKDTAGLASNTVITLEPIQAGSGDPSPSNVRTISGYEKVDIVASGKNLWDEQWELGGFYWDNGQPAPASDRIRSKNFNTIVGGQSYYGKGISAIFYYDAQYNFISYTSAFNMVINAPSDAVYFKVTINRTSYTGASGINYPATATAYEPYNPLTDLSIAMPGTIYGGTLDVESGELVVDKKKVLLSDLTVTYISGSNPVFEASNISDMLIPTGRRNNITCSAYKTIIASEASVENNTILSSGDDILIRDSRYTSASDLVSNMGNTVIVYELATPITYHLTPHQVALLQGANVVTTNGTSISLTHRQGQIAAQEDLVALAESVNSVENAALASGIYINGSGISVIAQSQLVDYTPTKDGILVITTNSSSIGFGTLQFPDAATSIGFANTISLPIKKNTHVTTSGAVHIAYFIPSN